MDRTKMLYKIYKACVIDENFKQALIENWYWVWERLWMDEEEKISNEVLAMVILWLESYEP